jgi:hypothetical protein
MKRKLLAASALLFATMTLSACGGNSDKSANAGSSSSTDTAGDKIVAFAKCMRDNGVKVADPAPGSSRVQIDARGVSQEQLQKAQATCAKYSPEGGGPGDPQRDDAMLQFAKCMRDNGVQIEDPQPGQPIKIQNNGQDETKIDKANAACAKYMGPGAGGPTQAPSGG